MQWYFWHFLSRLFARSLTWQKLVLGKTDQISPSHANHPADSKIKTLLRRLDKKGKVESLPSLLNWIEQVFLRKMCWGERRCRVILHPWVATITVAIFSANYLALIFSCNHQCQPPNSQLNLQIWKHVNKLTTIKCDFINKQGNELPLCPFCFPNKGCWAHWGRYVGSKIKAKTRVTIKSQISSHAPTI